jgi:hypothetical protein
LAAAKLCSTLYNSFALRWAGIRPMILPVGLVMWHDRPLEWHCVAGFGYPAYGHHGHANIGRMENVSEKNNCVGLAMRCLYPEVPNSYRVKDSLIRSRDGTWWNRSIGHKLVAERDMCREAPVSYSSTFNVELRALLLVAMDR